MNDKERIQDLEATLRDIVGGCDMMLQIPLDDTFKRYVLEVRRVAVAPLETVHAG